ncbi:hypothetical protein ACJ6WF_43430 [Streptomyces sp. MMS24-I2-30]|uniref:hypothetical protein n=1 Tax=Streptomyces sp. MMS24-I2-30 TaxID=3351564 RepID=UPI003896B014
MSYPDQGGSDFEIFTAPPPPRTARELVAQEGIQAVRAALPAAEQQVFDQANPWQDIGRADSRLESRVAELEAFDADVQRNIDANRYTAAQAQIVWNMTAEQRQPLADAVQRAHQRAATTLNTYRENLITHIESRGLTQRVALRTGNYSTPELSTAQAAALYSPDHGRRGPRGGGQDRTPLAPGGNRQRRAR